MRPENSAPVNKQAAWVTSKGFQYSPNKMVQARESKFPMPIRDIKKSELNNADFVDLRGFRRGRLVVVGLLKDSKNWVARCDCGTYVVRKARSIKNEKNNQDRCEECRHLAFLKQEEAWRRTGKDQDIGDF